MARGVGVGFRPEFAGQSEQVLKHVDFLEYNQRRSLEMVRQDLTPYLGQIPVVIHSLNLSLGSVQPPPEHRLEAIKRTADLVDASWVSEHLSYCRHDDIEVDNFIALPYTDESIEIVSRHIINLKNLLGRPVIMENITHSFVWPDKQYSEAEFIKRVLEKADCGLLLDVTNLYLNSTTHGYDPYEFLQTIPADRVVQLHLAGHSEVDGQMVDSHVGGIDATVLGYTEWILKHTACDAMTIERDSEMSSFDDLLDDLQLCRELYTKYGKSPISK
ncbi:DUF692 domain-containing protein [Brevibacillus dissolubilis]|uniref:DUF692 domain-containing protein n=1 Tax=Brevibacillus dissolubilis TaxID=1844116 RepID=UPI0011171C30|nr:DUF692 domain-containing protein [Brevibacillus dissolubilis]